MTAIIKILLVISVPVLASLFSAKVLAQQPIKIAQSAWSELTPDERELIQKKHVIDLAEEETFGLIIDNQGANESTGATTGGANLGGSIANAAYIDNAIKGGNYSAKNQLAFGILGMVIGSSLDSKANSQYRYRYSVKLGSGNIKYFEETKSDPFRHSIGVCVSVPNITLIDQQICTQTAINLRATYIKKSVEQVAVMPLPSFPPFSNKEAEMNGNQNTNTFPIQVNCKLGTLAPVRTSAEKCELIKGSQVQ